MCVSVRFKSRPCNYPRLTQAHTFRTVHSMSPYVGNEKSSVHIIIVNEETHSVFYLFSSWWLVVVVAVLDRSLLETISILPSIHPHPHPPGNYTMLQSIVNVINSVDDSHLMDSFWLQMGCFPFKSLGNARALSLNRARRPWCIVCVEGVLIPG